jgi:hypothetical protein
MDHSVFMDKMLIPDENSLSEALGNTYQLWKELLDSTINANKNLVAEWNYGGAKYGWSFRVKDKKRVIVYLLPRDKYFKAAFVFGDKAIDTITQSNISQTITNELLAAKKYTEGRGIRIDVLATEILPDVQHLVAIKLRH